MKRKRIKIVYKWDGYICTKCQNICRLYEQGLACSCTDPWISEILDEKDYPDYWVSVEIVATPK